MKRFPLLPRKRNTDKRHYGHTLIIGGSRAMTGAPVMTAAAALRSGSGLVTLAFPANIASKLSRLSPEIMRLELPSTGGAVQIASFVRKRHISAIGLGPGFSVSPAAVRLVRRTVKTSVAAVVLDADGLNAYNGAPALLKDHAGPLVLTPHRREFERLFGEKWPAAEAERVRLAKKLSKFYHVVLVLKGPRTLVVDGDRRYTNTTGNPGMAKGGSGDVLTGIITAFIAQGLKPFEAAAWGVHVHGLAGDIAVKKTGELGLTASDIIEALPRAFKKIS